MEDDEAVTTEKAVDDQPADEKADKKKKKKKKSKKKGLGAFMENEAEASAFKAEEEQIKPTLIEELPESNDGPTIEELPDEPEEAAESDKEADLPSHGSILLKDDERTPPKTVTFDIESSNVKEFYKNEQIAK